METPNVARPGIEENGRRGFLKVFIGVFSSLIGAALAVPFIAAVIGRPAGAAKGGFARVGPVSALPLGEPVDVAYTETFADAYLRENIVRHLWLLKRSATDVVAYSPVCPHLGCRYEWDQRDALFKCPCHESVFKIDGSVVAGPAPRPLDTLPAEVREGVLYVRWELFKVGTPRKVPA
jgi:menaquinol-cytochrome c reductase iron-sulfur subunit